MKLCCTSVVLTISSTDNMLAHFLLFPCRSSACQVLSTQHFPRGLFNLLFFIRAAQLAAMLLKLQCGQEQYPNCRSFFFDNGKMCTKQHCNEELLHDELFLFGADLNKCNIIMIQLWF